jgi:transcriptional accessory protein Tex/SPT6
VKNEGIKSRGEKRVYISNGGNWLMGEKEHNEATGTTEQKEDQVAEIEATTHAESESRRTSEEGSYTNLENGTVEAAAADDSQAEKPEQSSEDSAKDTEKQHQVLENAGEEDQQDEPMEEQSFQELYEESLKSIREGEVLRGTIIQMTDEYAMVDIGYKSEGQISMSEFVDEKGNIAAKVGDEVDVLLEYREDENGEIVLSKEKAAKIKVWDEISNIYREDGVIEGRVVSKVKGGLSVDIGVQAFLPGSQVDLRPVRNLDSLIGQQFDFKILK